MYLLFSKHTSLELFFINKRLGDKAYNFILLGLAALNRPLFDDLVPYYEILEGRNWETELGLVASVLRRYKSRSVVDLGCGTGRHVRELASLGFDATGIDLSSECINFAKKWARREGSDARFITGNYYQHPFGKKFDAALCLNWSIPVKDAEITRYLTNVSTIIRNGGVLIFDYEKYSEVDWKEVGTPVVESWKIEGDAIVRVSVGRMENTVLASDDVYLLFQPATGKEIPTEETRYKRPDRRVQPGIYTDTSFVRFFSRTEIAEFASKSGFRLILNSVLPRNRHRRNYAVLRKVS